MGKRYGASKCISIDILMERSLGEGEVVLRICPVAAQKVPRATVIGACSRFGFYQYLAGASEPVSCTVVIFKNAKFLDGIDNRQNIHIAEISGIHVFHAVQSERSVFD